MINALLIGGPKDGTRLVVHPSMEQINFPGLGEKPIRFSDDNSEYIPGFLVSHVYRRVSLHGKAGRIVCVYQYVDDDSCPLERLIEGYREIST